jgi:hypothetical protein
MFELHFRNAKTGLVLQPRMLSDQVDRQILRRRHPSITVAEKSEKKWGTAIDFPQAYGHRFAAKGLTWCYSPSEINVRDIHDFIAKFVSEHREATKRKFFSLQLQILEC